MAKPLVTFAVFAYNQEQFIAEAIRAALKQNYEPLEIIISDDASTDSTYELIDDSCRDYIGPHSLTTQRNNSNLGIANHVNKLVGQAQGDLIVLAAGDDISFPERTTKIVEYWEEFDRPAVVYSGSVVIDSSGAHVFDSHEQKRRLPNSAIFEQPGLTSAKRFLVEKDRYPYIGASQAVTRSLFEVFGKLPSNVRTEDATIGFRSMLVGGRLFIPEELLFYRLHSAAASSVVNAPVEDSHRATEQRYSDLQAFLAPSYRSFLVDLDRALDRELVDSSQAREVRRILGREWRVRQAIGVWWELSVMQRFGVYRRTFIAHGTAKQKRWALKRLVGIWPIALASKLRKLRSRTPYR
jgi:glycosyltransferase involved in cell wall biosynthesis